jgi:hypothetical protein
VADACPTQTGPVSWREGLGDASSDVIPGLANQGKKRLRRGSRANRGKRECEDKTKETPHGITLGAKFRGNVQQITHAWAGILTLFSLVLNGTIVDRGNDYEAKDFAGTI